MEPLHYVIACVVLPDKRILLCRQRLSDISFTQWRATAEYVIEGKDDVFALLVSKFKRDFGVDLRINWSMAHEGVLFRVEKLNVIVGPSKLKYIHPYLIIMNSRLSLHTSVSFQFTAKSLDALLVDIATNSMYKPGLVRGDEKHSSNSIHLVNEINRRNLIPNGRTNFQSSSARR